MKNLALVLLLFSTSLSLSAADAALGKWNLNLSKSRYDPGPAPKSETRIYRLEHGETKAAITTVYKDGHSQTVIYPATYDGKEHPVSGSPDTDGVVMTQIDDYTAESTITHAGKTIGKTRRVVARDRQTMTITFKGVAENGDPVNNTAVFQRIEEY
ncbi:MAG: hypothetical protein ABI824_19945 [Acidobacteriota bacterium]